MPADEDALAGGGAPKGAGGALRAKPVVAGERGVAFAGPVRLPRAVGRARRPLKAD